MRYYDMRAFYTVTQSRTILEQEIGNLYGYSAPMEALFIRPRCLVPLQVRTSLYYYIVYYSGYCVSGSLVYRDTAEFEEIVI